MPVREAGEGAAPEGQERHWSPSKLNVFGSQGAQRGPFCCVPSGQGCTFSGNVRVGSSSSGGMSAFWSIEVSSQLTLTVKFCPMPPAGHQGFVHQLQWGSVRHYQRNSPRSGTHPLL